jgi:hypothetical protein
MQRSFALTFCLISSLCVKAQNNLGGFKLPEMPQAPQPAIMPRYSPLPSANTRGQVKAGATAEDILKQVNRNGPYYGVGSDQASIQRANEAWIHAQMANDPAYNPALRNGVRNNIPINKDQELLRDLQDIVNMDNGRAAARGSVYEDYNSPDFAAKTKPYTDALRTLKDMLSGKCKLSIAEAYFTMENAYGESYLTQAEFKSIIQQSTEFIRQWMIQNNQNLKDNAAINSAVQQFMGNKLMVRMFPQKNDGTKTLQTVTHLPFFYDYNDYQGDKDHRNYFLTKCLATGSGQCNSMPAVYLVLVEALGGTAYLAVAPQHSLIKYPDKKGSIRNFEPTSNWDISDEWYQEHMFISKQAINNGVYLNPLSKKQLIADIALQLSFGYCRKFGGADGKFINECVNTAKSQFPKNNNLAVYFTLAGLYRYQLAQAMRKDRIDRIGNISQSLEAQKIYEKWLANEQIISKLGYQEEPKNMYEEMMQQHEFKGKIQQQRNISGKEKRNLFIKSN